MSFEYPLLLLLFPALALCLYLCKERSSSLILPHLDLLRSVKKSFLSLSLIKYLILLLFIIALSSPVEKSFTLHQQNAYSEVLIFDVSDSMRERLRDGEQKFQAAHRVCKAFIKKRENDLIGLTVFGEYAYIASPLTDDKELLQEILDSIYIGISGKTTAIYDALFLTAQHFSKVKSKEKIAILLTDGEDTASKITKEAAMRMLKTYNIKVHTIGLGDENRFDRTALEYIAKTSGGEFFLASDSKTLASIYTYIDQLEKSKIERKNFSLIYYYHYPLTFALILLFILIYIRNKRSI